MTDDLVFTAEDRENFQNAFKAFDESQSNRVLTERLGKLLRAVGFNPFAEEIEDMMRDSGESTFDFDSFMYIVYRHARCVDPERELIDAFKVFDKKGEGKLTVPLVRQILLNLKQPFTDDQINELFVQAEIKPGAQYVDYNEFVKVMLEF
jgi:Ca2+-binding EF-hand superfamily protein